MTNENNNLQSSQTRKEDTTNNDDKLFIDDDNSLQTKEEHEEDENNRPGKNEKLTPIEPDTTTPTLGDKISIDFTNEDLFTPVKNDDTSSYTNEDDQAPR